MFGKLKEKLKSWFSFSKEKIEETAPIEKLEEEPKKKKEKSKDKKQKVKEEKVKVEEKIKELPQDHPKTIKEAEEESKKTQELAVDIEKQIEKVEQLIEKAKEEDHPAPPLKYDATGRIIEPDLEKVKEEAEAIHKSVQFAKKIEKEKKEIEEKILKKSGVPLQEEPEKKSFFARIKSAFSYKISENEFSEMFDDLEMGLLENNVALEVVEALRKKLAERLIGKEIKRDELEEEIKKELRISLEEMIIEPDNPLDIIKVSKKPFVILFFGINGTGKTTSIAKIAHFLKKSNFSVVLAAADTFRAASIEQLAEHAKRLDIPLIKHDYGADPAAVGFDAIKYAQTHHMDVVLIDTAGRMHTKSNLIEEMKKIERVNKPDLKIFVAESIAGNDATEQAKTFHNAINIDGSILSKADIDEKGGTILSVSYVTNKPIFYLGTGQNYDDLQLFNKEKFIESLGL
ncbi:MAG: hypothetical protein RL557_1022 [archaeon]|jgi:fused signal recognition particle receptor